MNAQAHRALVEKPMDHIDLALQGFERRERLAQLHLGAGAFGTPMIFIDAAAEKDHAKAFRKDFFSYGPRFGGERFQPWQRQSDSGAAKNGAPGNAVGRWIHLIGHFNYHLSVEHSLYCSVA